MKYKCVTAFEHSGVKTYERDGIYDLSEKDEEALRALKKGKGDESGALRFFERVKDTAGAQAPGEAAAQDGDGSKTPGGGPLLGFFGGGKK
jgi:hypothetical protein